ncbi:cation:dicarboxylate symporter family transporter [Streptomyces sp. NPDC054855]
MEPIGTTFITAMKMLIGPIVFLTIIGGIAGVTDLKKVGRTGVTNITTRMLSMLRAGAYRRRIENRIRTGNTLLP